MNSYDDWNTYESKNLNVSFRYPRTYKIISETACCVSLGLIPDNHFAFLMISSLATPRDYKSYQSCPEDTNTRDVRFPCIRQGKYQKQKNRYIQQTTLGGKLAKSYYFSDYGGLYYITQTEEPPFIEMRMQLEGNRSFLQISSGKLDYDYRQILPTFKFIK